MSRGRDRRKKQARRWASEWPTDPKQVDGTLAFLAKFVDERYGDIFEAEHTRRLKRLDKPKVGTELGPAEAAAVFEAHYGAVRELATRATLPLSAFGWLWYLRRLPNDVFAWGSDLASTAPYDRALAEIISGMSTRPFADDLVSVSSGTIKYPLDAGRIEHVLRYCARISLMSDIERQYRRAAKGTRFVSTSEYLDPVPNTELDQAIAEYDLRSLKDYRPLEAGSETLIIPSKVSDLLGSQHLVLLTFPSKEVGAALRDIKSQRADLDTLYFGQFLPQFAAIDPLLYLLDKVRTKSEVPVEPGVPELLALLALLGQEAFLKKDEHILLGAQRTGYVVRRSEFFNDAYAALLPSGLRNRIEGAFGVVLPTSGQQLIASLRGVESSPRPLIYGPIVRDLDDEHYAIDLRMATNRLLMAGTGVLRDDTIFKNEVADSFEKLTRALVDQTGKSPGASLSPFVGRDIRYKGKAITDLDAIAELPEGILLISCKSVAGTPSRVSGLHAPVRNTAGRLEEDVEVWKGIVERLKAFPVGDNYDFTGRALFGVVVTPRLQWAGFGFGNREAVRRIDGRSLRWVSSVSELEEFLRD